MSKRVSRATVIAVAIMICATEAGAERFSDQFKDDDGWLDASDWVLNNATGFMPVPLIITEPAIGEGFGLAALFFHPPKDYDEAEYEDAGKANDGEETKFVLPDVSGIAAAKTSNGSWLVGGGHFAHWKDDHIRYEGVIGYASINLTFYGKDGLEFFEDGLLFNGKGLLIQQPISFRWKDTDFFLGVEYDYSELQTEFDLGLTLPPGLPSLNLDTRLSALGTFLYYDSRDTPFTPTSGLEAKLRVQRNDQALGSDVDYTLVQAFVRKYAQFDESWFLGFRLRAETVTGDTPFYMVPFIGMRGIPALRYQGEAMALAEAELRWAFHPRISVLGFLGAGKAAESYGDFGDSVTRVSKGLGIRYFAARKLGMHVGFDFAVGPEDTYWYLTMGRAWF